jgi:1,4-dihydroxy-2-naphthoate octaprenyltransferase
MSGKPSSLTIACAAIRPQTLPAAAAPVAVGGALALAHGHAHPMAWFAALIGALLIQIFANLYNDYADYKRGADGADRLGPARVTQKGWLSEKQVLLACCVCVFLSLLIGAYLVFVGGWPILVIGLVSLVCAYLYTGGPAPLAYTGLGDLFVLLFFGEVAVAGTYFLISQTLHPAALVCGAIVGLPITAILVINNLRDARTDAVAGKRTLVVRFGQRFGRIEYTICLLGAYALIAASLGLDILPTGTALAFVALPFAIVQLRRLAHVSGAELNPMLGQTARHGMLLSALLSAGVLL